MSLNKRRPSVYRILGLFGGGLLILLGLALLTAQIPEFTPTQTEPKTIYVILTYNIFPANYHGSKVNYDFQKLWICDENWDEKSEDIIKGSQNESQIKENLEQKFNATEIITVQKGGGQSGRNWKFKLTVEETVSSATPDTKKEDQLLGLVFVGMGAIMMSLGYRFKGGPQ